MCTCHLLLPRLLLRHAIRWPPVGGYLLDGTRQAAEHRCHNGVSECSVALRDGKHVCVQQHGDHWVDVPNHGAQHGHGPAVGLHALHDGGSHRRRAREIFDEACQLTLQSLDIDGRVLVDSQCERRFPVYCRRRIFSHKGDQLRGRRVCGAKRNHRLVLNLGSR